MATPNAKTKIVNLALGHLKIDAITSIDPPDADSKAALAGAKWYDQARRDTLEAHPWKFASKPIHLVADPVSPLFEYDKKYELPPDFIRICYVGNDYRFPVRDFDIQGNFIVCNETSPLPMVYVYDFSDATKFSPKFITSMSYRLASFMAYEMTGNAQLVEAMDGQFTKSLTQAASVSGQNRPTRRVQRSRLAEARRSIGRYDDWRSWGDN